MSYSSQIRACEEKIARKQALKKRLPELEKKKAELEQIVRRRWETKRAEQSDVDRLEAGGPKALMLSLLGQREDKLEKERQEAYEAAARYEVSAQELAQVTAEWERARAEWEALAQCEQEYEAAIAGQQQLLIDAGGIRGDEVRRLAEDVAALKHRKEILEAVSMAGGDAWKASRKLEEMLKDADTRLMGTRSHDCRYELLYINDKLLPEFQTSFAVFEELARKEDWSWAGQLAEHAEMWRGKITLNPEDWMFANLKVVRQLSDDVAATQGAIRIVMAEIEERWKPIQERFEKVDAQLRERIRQSC